MACARVWSRAATPTLSSLDPGRDDLLFQQFECHYQMVPSVAQTAAEPKEEAAPLLSLFGVAADGTSILCRVTGFRPYFYVQPPPGWAFAEAETIKGLRSAAAHLLDGGGVLDVSQVHRHALFYYHGESRSTFYRVTVQAPRSVVTLRQAFELARLCVCGQVQTWSTFESAIPFGLRFMIDRQIPGASWVRVGATRYRCIGSPAAGDLSEATERPMSTAQLEVETTWEAVLSAEVADDVVSAPYPDIAPLRLLSFDIECSSESFPNAAKDPVIVIGNVLWSSASPVSEVIRVAFVLGTCKTIYGAHVLSFQTEREMLLAWRDFVVEADPDMLTGYNIVNFDLPYLLKRAAVLGAYGFADLTKVRGAHLKIDAAMPSGARSTAAASSNKANGPGAKRRAKQVESLGRTILDVFLIVLRDHNLRSYTLNSVCAEFLNEQKEDVHPSAIGRLFRGSDEDRRRVTSYCIKDCILPIRLIDRLKLLISTVELARITRVPLSYLLQRGQAIRVLSQIYYECHDSSYLVPNLARGQGNPYQGASVVEPKAGFYVQPVAILDFVSLYPSIIIAKNICYTTLLADRDAAALPPDRVQWSPAGHAFVTRAQRPGVLPRILQNLITQRQALKRLPNPSASILARQLALKLAANSIYGFTGSPGGGLFCRAISESVTAFGREMIAKTVQLIERRYLRAAGYPADAKVIYGDTDSVMITFGGERGTAAAAGGAGILKWTTKTTTTNPEACDAQTTPREAPPHDITIAEAMSLGHEAASYVTTQFERPVTLEFEKVYCPYLLSTKKRYAGLLYSCAAHPDRIDTKGIETVRRDNCLLVKAVISSVLRSALVDRDVDGALAYVQGVIRDLYMNRVDISMLVVTKALDREDYKGKQAHVELSKRLQKQGDRTFHVGDRIPYVIIRGMRGEIDALRAEDPIKVLEMNLPIDADYYVKMLTRPLARLFGAILPDPMAAMLLGSHMKHKTIFVPTGEKRGILQFTQGVRVCAGCQTRLPDTRNRLCERCAPKLSELFARRLVEHREHERDYARLWAQCQQCQGSFHQEVLCTARDCPIFYQRTRQYMELCKSKQALERLAGDDALNW